MAAVMLVRHADAGERDRWDGPDRLRPLTEKGWGQARRLADRLGGYRPARVLSSPYVRCVQTVEPLAEQIGLPVEHSGALAEGATVGQVADLLEPLRGRTAVLCTHGDVIPTLLDHLVERDGLDLPPHYPYAKGSTWVLLPDGQGRFARAEYLPTP